MQIRETAKEWERHRKKMVYIQHTDWLCKKGEQPMLQICYDFWLSNWVHNIAHTLQMKEILWIHIECINNFGLFILLCFNKLCAYLLIFGWANKIEGGNWLFNIKDLWYPVINWISGLFLLVERWLQRNWRIFYCWYLNVDDLILYLFRIYSIVYWSKLRKYSDCMCV